jgi:hypothetical protein
MEMGGKMGEGGLREKLASKYESSRAGILMWSGTGDKKLRSRRILTKFLQLIPLIA